MFAPYRVGVIACGLLAVDAVPLKAVESIGRAVEIKTAVTGARGDLSINDPVFQDERIRTSKSGLGQFIFRDGTKLAVGWGSSVVVDKFVFDGSHSVKKLTIKAAKGTFRWVSGKSNHTAYEILTPAGTIGVRGTAFDFYIGGDGTTAVVLLGGAASFCGAGGCRQLTRRCDHVVAKRGGAVTNTRRVDRGIFKALGNARALPFLSGNQKLAASGGYGGCGLARADDIQRDEPDRNVPSQVRPQRETPDPPGKDPKPNDDKPHQDPGGDHGRPHDQPDRGHDHHDRHDDHDKPDKSDNPDRAPSDRGTHDRGPGDHDKHDRQDHDGRQGGHGQNGRDENRHGDSGTDD
ncbi:FecR domain-containing protein [Pararhizobium sp. DWP3-4]|uniref:FecR family protein n=1 Tax=Pararhizobium sp. DWP3-4 TaxID=2804565 RepID=UPI003CF0302E